MEQTIQSPQTESSKKRMYIIISVIVLLLIIVGTYFVFFKRDTVKPTAIKKRVQSMDAPIPTVDESVRVSVASSGKKKFNLAIEGIPTGTESLEYVVTYETKDGGLPGISSTVELEAGQEQYEKKDILLGTCSTGGACIYHELASPLNVVVKFVGSYGERISENEFELK